MATLTEALEALEKTKPEQPQLNSSKFVYSTQSGTKDIHTQFNIGGRSIKRKVYRNPKPIFGMSESSFESPKSATAGRIDHEAPIEAASGVVNIYREPEIHNTDTKGTGAQTERVYGLYRMGGAGTDYAEAHIQKIEELKLLKQESGIELQFKQKEPKQGRWKSGL